MRRRIPEIDANDECQPLSFPVAGGHQQCPRQCPSFCQSSHPMKKLVCLDNPPLSDKFMLHESNDGHPAAEADCPDLQKCECEAGKRESCCLSGFGRLTPVTFTHSWSKRRSWHPAPGRLQREMFQIEDIEPVHIHINHEIGSPHGAHRKYV